MLYGVVRPKAMPLGAAPSVAVCPSVRPAREQRSGVLFDGKGCDRSLRAAVLWLESAGAETT